jgi:hypothetical protein
MFRVPSVPIIRSTIKTADAIIGTVHVSVWFKAIERCPRSGVYFTISWPIINKYSLCVIVVSPAAHLRDMSKFILGTCILSFESELLHYTKSLYVTFNIITIM